MEEIRIWVVIVRVLVGAVKKGKGLSLVTGIKRLPLRIALWVMEML